MHDLPKRKTDRLYKGRASIKHAQYFVTLVTDHRQPSLTSELLLAQTLSTMEKLESDGDLTNLCATVIPSCDFILLYDNPETEFRGYVASVLGTGECG